MAFVSAALGDYRVRPAFTPPRRRRSTLWCPLRIGYTSFPGSQKGTPGPGGTAAPSDPACSSSRACNISSIPGATGPCRTSWRPASTWLSFFDPWFVDYWLRLRALLRRSNENRLVLVGRKRARVNSIGNSPWPVFCPPWSDCGGPTHAAEDWLWLAANDILKGPKGNGQASTGRPSRAI
jgi:hypothetical protein